MTFRRPILAAFVAALALPLLAVDLERETYDLSPRFVVDQELSIRSEGLVSLGLDDASASIAGQELPEVPTLEVEVSFVEEATEKVLATRGDELAGLRRTYDAENFAATGEFGIMGEFQDFDESDDGLLVGHTFELTIDEEGDVSVEDVSEDESLEPVPDAQLAAMSAASHFEFLLPSEPVAVGETWDVGAAMLEEVERAFGALASEDEDAAQVVQFLEAVGEHVELEAIGKLVSAGEDAAQIEWNLEASVTISDLFDLVREFVDPADLEELPEDVYGEIEAEFTLKGGGTFDFATGQLTEYDLEGEHAFSVSFSMSQMEVEAAADFSGALELSGGVTVE